MADEEQLARENVALKLTLLQHALMRHGVREKRAGLIARLHAPDLKITLRGDRGIDEAAFDAAADQLSAEYADDDESTNQERHRAPSDENRRRDTSADAARRESIVEKKRSSGQYDPL
jgi:hypothetical protein